MKNELAALEAAKKAEVATLQNKLAAVEVAKKAETQLKAAQLKTSVNSDVDTTRFNKQPVLDVQKMQLTQALTTAEPLSVDKKECERLREVAALKNELAALEAAKKVELTVKDYQLMGLQTELLALQEAVAGVTSEGEAALGKAQEEHASAMAALKADKEAELAALQKELAAVEVTLTLTDALTLVLILT